MSLLNGIVVDPQIVHGRPSVRGTRMRVSDVLALLTDAVPCRRAAAAVEPADSVISPSVGAV